MVMVRVRYIKHQWVYFYETLYTCTRKTCTCATAHLKHYFLAFNLYVQMLSFTSARTTSRALLYKVYVRSRARGEVCRS